MAVLTHAEIFIFIRSESGSVFKFGNGFFEDLATSHIVDTIRETEIQIHELEICIQQISETRISEAQTTSEITPTSDKEKLSDEEEEEEEFVDDYSEVPSDIELIPNTRRITSGEIMPTPSENTLASDTDVLEIPQGAQIIMGKTASGDTISIPKYFLDVESTMDASLLKKQLEQNKKRKIAGMESIRHTNDMISETKAQDQLMLCQTRKMHKCFNPSHKHYKHQQQQYVVSTDSHLGNTFVNVNDGFNRRVVI